MKKDPSSTAVTLLLSSGSTSSSNQSVSQSSDDRFLNHMELKVNHDLRTPLTIGGSNNMTNGKKLSFSIDSLLNGSSLPISPTFHSVSKFLAATTTSSAIPRDITDQRNIITKYSPNNFSRFCSDREKTSSPSSTNNNSSTSCLQSSFYPWLLAQRQAVAAAFHNPFAG